MIGQKTDVGVQKSLEAAGDSFDFTLNRRWIGRLDGFLHTVLQDAATYADLLQLYLA